jgi:ethanolamine utilization cobalamin adenosyltransferase
VCIQINSLGFGLTLPNIKQKVLMEAVEFGLIIDVDIKDIREVLHKPSRVFRLFLPVF